MGSSNPLLKFDGFGRTHRTHANGATAILERKSKLETTVRRVKAMSTLAQAVAARRRAAANKPKPLRGTIIIEYKKAGK